MCIWRDRFLVNSSCFAHHCSCWGSSHQCSQVQQQRSGAILQCKRWRKRICRRMEGQRSLLTRQETFLKILAARMMRCGRRWKPLSVLFVFCRLCSLKTQGFGDAQNRINYWPEARFLSQVAAYSGVALEAE